MLQDTSLLYQQVHDLEASLAQLRNECSRAVTATQLIVGRPNTPLGSPRTSDDGSGSCSIEDAVQQLIGALKVSRCGIVKCCTSHRGLLLHRCCFLTLAPVHLKSQVSQLQYVSILDNSKIEAYSHLLERYAGTEEICGMRLAVSTLRSLNDTVRHPGNYVRCLTFYCKGVVISKLHGLCCSIVHTPAA